MATNELIGAVPLEAETRRRPTRRAQAHFSVQFRLLTNRIKGRYLCMSTISNGWPTTSNLRESTVPTNQERHPHVFWLLTLTFDFALPHTESTDVLWGACREEPGLRIKPLSGTQLQMCWYAALVLHLREDSNKADKRQFIPLRSELRMGRFPIAAIVFTLLYRSFGDLGQRPT